MELPDLCQDRVERVLVRAAEVEVLSVVRPVDELNLIWLRLVGLHNAIKLFHATQCQRSKYSESHLEDHVLHQMKVVLIRWIINSL